WRSEETATHEEGCLSIPDYYEDVERPQRIKVNYLDLDGKRHEIEADGLFATCLQHEIDHTNGVLFIDHISKLKRDRVVKTFTKAAKAEKAEQAEKTAKKVEAQLPLRLVFMGTPDFAVPTLVELVGAGHDIVAVYTRAPQPAGRGMELRESPVAREAKRLQLPVLTPKTLRTDDAAGTMRAHGADAAVVVAYRLILPKAILEAFPLACFNRHASLLPRWRGAAPIQRAIRAGDRETGATVMKMDEGLDTGPMAMAERIPIGPDTTAGALHDTMAQRG